MGVGMGTAAELARHGYGHSSRVGTALAVHGESDARHGHRGVRLGHRGRT